MGLSAHVYLAASFNKPPYGSVEPPEPTRAFLTPQEKSLNCFSHIGEPNDIGTIDKSDFQI